MERTDDHRATTTRRHRARARAAARRARAARGVTSFDLWKMNDAKALRLSTAAWA